MGLGLLEGQWQENVLTIEGHALHDKAHDPMSREKRKGKIIVRGMRVFSASLGISGDCDIVEFHQKKDGVFIPSFEGTYEVVPIEYKRGRPKEGEEDVFQLALQALCLEDMFCTTIPYGYIYYGETRRREKRYFRRTSGTRSRSSWSRCANILPGAIRRKYGAVRDAGSVP